LLYKSLATVQKALERASDDNRKTGGKDITIFKEEFVNVIV